jgi:hypothetical protein
MFYMPTGACSRGYKLRSREGKCPKSLGVVVSYECSISECGVLCVFVLLDSLVHGANLPYYSSRRAGVQGLIW